MYFSISTQTFLSGLNRYLKEKKRVDLFSTSRFERFRKVFDGYIKERQAVESVATRKAGCLTERDEQQLWHSSFGDRTPPALLGTVILYLFCKTFALRLV